MTVSVHTSGDTGVVALDGRFTFETHRAFKAATDPLLADPAIRAIHVDLSGLVDMDASSLGMLLVLREKTEAHGKDLQLVKLAPCAAVLMESLQFGKLFKIVK